VTPSYGAPTDAKALKDILEGTVLREFVVNVLGTEDGADEVLRRAWRRLEAMTLPLGTAASTMMYTLAEGEARELRQTRQPPATPIPGDEQDGPRTTAAEPT
jgi:hypothetical protein